MGNPNAARRKERYGSKSVSPHNAAAVSPGVQQIFPSIYCTTKQADRIQTAARKAGGLKGESTSVSPGTCLHPVQNKDILFTKSLLTSFRRKEYLSYQKEVQYTQCRFLFSYFSATYCDNRKSFCGAIACCGALRASMYERVRRVEAKKEKESKSVPPPRFRTERGSRKRKRALSQKLHEKKRNKKTPRAKDAI